jgi:hypothetical protein
MKTFESSVGDGEPVVERIEIESRRARASLDPSVVRAQRCDAMRRARASEGRCHQDCGCEGGKRQKPPPRRVCLPKHEGRTVPQLVRRKPRPGGENGTFAQLLN